MKWVFLVFFIFGLLFVAWGFWGARQDAKKGQSADVAMGDDFLKTIGIVIWLLGAVLIVLIAVVLAFI